MYVTIKNTSGGHHGHQLKDLIGGLTIAKVFNLTYLHRPYPYLDFFSLGRGERVVTSWKSVFKFRRRVIVCGPKWSGFDDYQKAVDFFSPFLTQRKNSRTIIILKEAIRIFPFQAISWFKKGLIKRNVFEEITREISEKFENDHQGDPSYFNPKFINIALHISRGCDYDREKFPQLFKSSFRVRHMFPIDYFMNICRHLRFALKGKRLKFHIYTEALNSEEIVSSFQGFSDTILHIGGNRGTKNQLEIQSIFLHFVKSDILVTCNSSFSTVCAYFRNQKPTIYHPHQHLRHLPETNFFQTDQAGNFDAARMGKLFR